MSSRTPNQDKALAWYCQTNNLKPQLSAHPVYFFTNEKGKTEERNIQHIVADWERWREEERKSNKRRTA
jgi:hypothetical protein